MSGVAVASGARGFSLVEFMIALLLGTILIAGAVAVYLASKTAFLEVEQVAELSENTRFAQQVLSDSLRHAGFFGGVHPRDIRGDSGLSAVTGDCTSGGGANPAAYALGDYLLAETADGDGEAFACVDDAVPGSDVLVVKQVQPLPLYDRDPDDASAATDGVISWPQGLRNDTLYIVANSERGLLMEGSDTPPNVGIGSEFALAGAWPYRTYIYYVRDLAVPSLARRELRLVGGAPTLAGEPVTLVPGVEQFQVRFGEDPDGDGNVDQFSPPAAVADYDSVQSVQVYLLLRSTTQDPDFDDDRSYDLGGVTVTPGADDHWRRQLLEFSVLLRNPQLRVLGGL